MEKLGNNKGLTLVELVIAITMSTIVMGAAAMFLYQANRSYNAAESSIDVQMEAQIVMEQLSNWVLESNKIYVLEDQNILVLYKIPRNNGRPEADVTPEGTAQVNSKALRRVIFAKGSKLYMVETDEIADAQADFNSIANPIAGAPLNLYQDSDVKDENCICEYLQYVDETGGYVSNSFQVTAAASASKDPSDKYTTTAVTISLTLKEGLAAYPPSYTVENTFGIRNGLFQKYTEPTAAPAESSEPGI